MSTMTIEEIKAECLLLKSEVQKELAESRQERIHHKTRVQVAELMPFIVADLQTGIILDCSERAEELFGYIKGGELIGKPYEVLVPERFRERHRCHFQRYATHPTTRTMGTLDHELWGVRKDGTEFPIEVALDSLMYSGCPAALAVIMTTRGS